MAYRTARLVVALVAIALLTLASVATAQETPSFAKNGVFVGASEVPNFTLDGVTFNGSTAYATTSGNEILILPRLQPKSTIRALAGYRLDRGSFEVSYERTTHVGTFLGATGQATFQMLNFDERIYVLTHRRIQPYGLLGVSLPRLTVKDGAAVGDQIGDGSFRGFGLNSEAESPCFPCRALASVPAIGIA